MQSRLVTIDYRPREAFRPYHDSPKRFAVTVAHRRAGKTVARINKLLKSALCNTQSMPRYGYLAPSFVQAKDIAWLYLKSFAWPAIEATGGKINESELSVTFGHNAATIRLYGAENADRMRGLYFDGISIDEAQEIAPTVLTSVIYPALLDRKGWLDISGTPKGWGNLLGQAYLSASGDAEWFVQTLKASKTGILDADELQRARTMMPANEYDQEFECSFDAAITGAYYAAELTEAQESGRITSVPHDPALLTHTVWDLGVSDSMSIWFVQVVGREVRVIDYLEDSGHGLDYYAKELQKKPYLYGKHFGPHDIEVREMSTGKSRRELALGMGLKFDVTPNLPVSDGISAARVLIPRCWFDKAKCADGLDALKQYREKIDKKRQVSMGPLHDWTSHAADAFRYLAINVDAMSPRHKPKRPARDEGARNWMAA